MGRPSRHLDALLVSLGTYLTALATERNFVPLLGRRSPTRTVYKGSAIYAASHHYAVRSMPHPADPQAMRSMPQLAGGRINMHRSLELEAVHADAPEFEAYLILQVC